MTRTSYISMTLSRLRESDRHGRSRVITLGRSEMMQVMMLMSVHIGARCRRCRRRMMKMVHLGRAFRPISMRRLSKVTFQT